MPDLPPRLFAGFASSFDSDGAENGAASGLLVVGHRKRASIAPRAASGARDDAVFQYGAQAAKLGDRYKEK